jgi:hypothetical protein
MAAKTVSVNLYSELLSREETGVVFSVKDGSSKYGELIVSKGGIRWKPKGNRDHHHLTWHDLDNLSREFPRR